MPPKRKTRFHGLYYHSTPPRVLPMRSQDPKRKSSDDFSIRLSTIRIWMHEKDIGKLTRVLWAGQGNRLRQQASTNPKVKRFLAAVPYVMNSIKDVHQSVVDNSLENLQATMESDVPPELITCKDANGLNVIHKAGGLAHTMMLEYLLSIWPDGAHEIDMTGKTPLHWAATAKDNMRCYTMLTEAGCDEEALDYKMKTPIYYKTRLSEIERSFLTQVPDAPRVSQDIPIDWEALASDESDDRKKQEINITKGRRSTDLLGNTVNLLTPRSEANSLENTSEPDLDQGDNTKDESTDVEVDAKTLANGYMTTSELETDHGSPQRTPEKHQMGDKNGSPKKEVEKLTREENVGNALSDEKIKEDNRVSEVDDNETKYADDDVNIVELQIDDEDVQKEIKINEEKEEKEKEHQTDEKLAEDLGTKIEDAHPIKTDNEHFVNEEKKEIDTENDNEKTDVTDIIQEMSKIHYDEILREQLLSEEKKTKKYVGSESYVFSPSEQKIQMEGIQKPPYLDEQNSLENVSLSSEEYILTQNLGKISSEDLGARNLLKESPPLRLGSARSFHTREIVDKSDEVKIKDNHNKNAGKKEEKLKKQEEEDDDDDDQVQFGSL